MSGPTEKDLPVYLRLDPAKCVVRSYSVVGGAGKRPRLKLEIDVDPEELAWMLRDLAYAREKPRPKATTRKRPARAVSHQPLLQITHAIGGEKT